eukprot:scaffold256_cov261-Pinguiococcus_pyrenoidosus.AAC.4
MASTDAFCIVFLLSPAPVMRGSATSLTRRGATSASTALTIEAMASAAFGFKLACIPIAVDVETTIAHGGDDRLNCSQSLLPGVLSIGRGQVRDRLFADGRDQVRSGHRYATARRRSGPTSAVSALCKSDALGWLIVRIRHDPVEEVLDRCLRRSSDRRRVGDRGRQSQAAQRRAYLSVEGPEKVRSRVSHFDVRVRRLDHRSLSNGGQRGRPEAAGPESIDELLQKLHDRDLR